MASYLVTWEESGIEHSHEIHNLQGYADAAWFVALEQVEDATNAKLLNITRLS